MTRASAGGHAAAGGRGGTAGRGPRCDFVSASARLLASVDDNVVAPGFTERLTVASRGGGDGEPRSIAAPYYLTDLGVRKFEDPRVFMDAHLDLLGDEHRSHAAADLALLIGAPIDDLGRLLDAFVLVKGDYENARRAVSERFTEILAEGTAALLVQVGVLDAGWGDDRARVALRRAAEVARFPTDRFMALHRLAAAEIKRFGRPDEALRMLDELDRDIEADRAADLLSEGDRRTLLSVTANLRALGLMRSGRSGDVRAEIIRSRGLHTLDDLREVVPGEASRYGAQERINVAQVLSGDGEAAAAVEALEENVGYCREHNPDYVGEALTALAYGLFRAGHFAAAACTAADAAARIAFEASPTRLRAAREIQVAACFRADDVDAARTALRHVRTDPLGLTLSRPHGVEDSVR